MSFRDQIGRVFAAYCQKVGNEYAVNEFEHVLHQDGLPAKVSRIYLNYDSRTPVFVARETGGSRFWRVDIEQEACLLPCPLNRNSFATETLHGFELKTGKSETHIKKGPLNLRECWPAGLRGMDVAGERSWEIHQAGVLYFSSSMDSSNKFLETLDRMENTLKELCASHERLLSKFDELSRQSSMAATVSEIMPAMKSEYASSVAAESLPVKEFNSGPSLRPEKKPEPPPNVAEQKVEKPSEKAPPKPLTMDLLGAEFVAYCQEVAASTSRPGWRTFVQRLGERTGWRDLTACPLLVYRANTTKTAADEMIYRPVDLESLPNFTGDVWFVAAGDSQAKTGYLLPAIQNPKSCQYGKAFAGDLPPEPGAIGGVIAAVVEMTTGNLWALKVQGQVKSTESLPAARIVFAQELGAAWISAWARLSKAGKVFQEDFFNEFSTEFTRNNVVMRMNRLRMYPREAFIRRVTGKDDFNLWLVEDLTYGAPEPAYILPLHEKLTSADGLVILGNCFFLSSPESGGIAGPLKGLRAALVSDTTPNLLPGLKQYQVDWKGVLEW